MGSAFTPGLTISDNVTIRKTRRLPVKGEVIVKTGDSVESTSVVAKVDLPGTLAVIKAAPLLGCAPEQLRNFCLVDAEDSVKRDQLIAMRKVFFGLVTNRARSPIDGTVEYISNLSGNIGVRGKPKPLSCNAFISGTIVDVIEEEGVVVETTGALVQGIFGVGGERHGKLEWIDNGSEVLTAADITEDHRNKILLHNGRLDGSLLEATVEHGVLGLIGASIIDSELMAYLGFDIGVAVTGEEDIPFTLIVTEGFGQLTMPERTESLLRKLCGSNAAINGATQIRAGVIRPELIVSRETQSNHVAVAALELKAGSRVRLIRRPNFGKTGKVTSLPEQPQLINTGSMVRVTTVQLDNGPEVTIPRANIEILD
jgi:hypothetical protein